MTLTPDQINGGFELGGAFLNLLNVRALYRAKTYKGVHWGPFLFFLVWGMWNLLFYPANGLWWSFYGGLLIVLVNAAWLWLALWYSCDRWKGPERRHWEMMLGENSLVTPES